MRGFTIFFAMLVGGLALTIGAAIYDLTVRQLQLSAISVESQYALYAADAGAECALYWDSKYEGGRSVFATSSAGAPASAGALCGTQDIAAEAVAAGTWPLVADAGQAQSVFTLTFLPHPYCATVYVNKIVSPPLTVIESHGFNSCNTNDPLRVERVLKVTY